MKATTSLRAKQEAMRQRSRGAPRKQLVPFQIRRDEIMKGLGCIGNPLPPLSLLRAVTANKKWGRGWWRKTISQLCRMHELEIVPTRHGEVIRRKSTVIIFTS
jgi:hypothetical protein